VKKKEKKKKGKVYVKEARPTIESFSHGVQHIRTQEGIVKNCAPGVLKDTV